MLPSWQNKLAIAIAPTYLTLVHSKHGWRTRDGSMHARVPVAPSEGATWIPTLGALDERLRENNKIARGAKVTVTVADCYVRYALIPWSSGIVTQSEFATYSQLYFDDLFGSTGANWHVKTDWDRYGQPGIACALDKDLVGAISELLGKHNMRLTSLCSHFVAVYNQWRHHVTQKEALLAVVDSGQCTLATFQGKQWRSIRSVRMQRIEAELSAGIEREILLQGLTEQVPVYLHISDPAATGPLPLLRDNVKRIGSLTSTEVSAEATSVMPEPC